MPNLGAFHPQVVHFVIALGIVGVGLRLLSLLNRWSWINQAAVLLLVLGAGATVASVKTGDDAHGPAERVPGARDAVVEHEQWGERTRNMFLVIAGVELLGLAVAGRKRRAAHALSALLGLGGLFAVYETGEHGGKLVYSYAGGVGVRTGDPQDVERLLTAGLYHQAMLDRREGRRDAASALFQQLAARHPNDMTVQILAVESLLRDKRDVAAARQAVEGLAPNDDRTRRAAAVLKVDILAAAGHKDSARAILEPIVAALLQPNPRLQAKLDSLRP